MSEGGREAVSEGGREGGSEGGRTYRVSCSVAGWSRILVKLHFWGNGLGQRTDTCGGYRHNC